MSLSVAAKNHNWHTLCPTSRNDLVMYMHAGVTVAYCSMQQLHQHPPQLIGKYQHPSTSSIPLNSCSTISSNRYSSRGDWLQREFPPTPSTMLQFARQNPLKTLGRILQPAAAPARRRRARCPAAAPAATGRCCPTGSRHAAQHRNCPGTQTAAADSGCTCKQQRQPSLHPALHSGKVLARESRTPGCLSVCIFTSWWSHSPLMPTRQGQLFQRTYERHKWAY